MGGSLISHHYSLHLWNVFGELRSIGRRPLKWLERQRIKRTFCDLAQSHPWAVKASIVAVVQAAQPMTGR